MNWSRQIGTVLTRISARIAAPFPAAGDDAINRGTVYRIAGFALLAFAAVSIYRREFGVDGISGVVITRAPDLESFWRGVIVQVGVGCALLYASRFAPTGPPSSSAPSRPGGRGQAAEECPKLPNCDPVFCGKVVKRAACVCVGLIIAELLVLLLVHPSDDRCPGWIFLNHRPLSLWFYAGMVTVLPALWICNVALRWDQYYARKMYDSIAYGLTQQLLIDVNWLMMTFTAVWCLICAIPLLLMLGQCTALSHYLNLNALF